MAEQQWIPARNDIVLLDFEPATGKEMGKKRPALVLTSEGYNQTGLMMVCPSCINLQSALTMLESSTGRVACVKHRHTQP